jgi:hypothetical protein
MQPLDRDNVQFRHEAAAMRAVTLQQRHEDEQQRSRTRVLKAQHEALRTRLRLDQHYSHGAPGTRP